ncbi:guanylate kinase [Microlunatus endophyticus]|uniref:Guanylate kinase n=1 Tax=Microlunatus endophyticus TaxID=1716077 RepID=A0A917S1Y3_9ACTN|nr:guanylate kinase [Microlunatus endophyticus]
MGIDTSRLVVLSGPSAVGKGTVMNRLREVHPEVFISVSATTRRPRPGEQDGVHYLFVSEAEFDELIASGALLEWAIVHGAHRYGTPRQPLLDALEAGRPAILEVDLQGARQVRASWPEARFVFLAPPTWEELLRRQQVRGTEDVAEQQRRMQTAQQEMAAQGEFDHTIVNRDVEQAVQELVDLLHL